MFTLTKRWIGFSQFECVHNCHVDASALFLLNLSKQKDKNVLMLYIFSIGNVPI